MNIKIKGYNNYEFEQKYVDTIYKSIEKFNQKIIDISNIEFPIFYISPDYKIDGNMCPTDRYLKGQYNIKYKRITLIQTYPAEMEQAIIHELGHHIHNIWFNNQNFKWNDRMIYKIFGDYGISTKEEKFAHIFQLCYMKSKSYYNKNEKEMIKLLKNFNKIN